MALNALNQISNEKFQLIKQQSPISQQSVDSDLVGDWVTNSGQMVRIGTDDWYYMTAPPYAYQVSTDGLSLTLTDSDPDVVYTRLYGSGTEITGTWLLSIADGSDTYIEEWTIRADGTYTSHWTINGQFDSEYFGNYEDQTSHIKSEERRALLNTSAPDFINFDVPYGADFSGTYLKANIDEWVLNVGGSSITHIRS